MRVKVQEIWNGTRSPAFSDGRGFRALVYGGVIVYGNDWNRKTASLMLDAIARETGWDRRRIRFVHV